VKHGFAALAAAAAVVAAACSAGSSPSPSTAVSAVPATAAASASATPAAAIDLTVYGAASLKGALEKAKTAYEAANPGTTLTISTDSSAALATQIEQGAPADVFLSADTRNPQALIDTGLANAPAVSFATTRLTVIVPTDNPAGITTPAELAGTGVKIIAAGNEVPITKYATQLVDNLAKEAGYPADFAAAYAANVVSKEDTVTAVVAKVALGEGDAAIVYATDAAASGEVVTVDVPEGANVLATYAGVVVKESPHADAAEALLAWFAGPEGQAILQSFGFLPPAS
jgi:molybdate transport system substrate-binding protein